MALFLIKTLEYNGGMWNLAQRYMAAPSGAAAKRSALLSAGLWLVWPVRDTWAGSGEVHVHGDDAAPAAQAPAP